MFDAQYNYLRFSNSFQLVLQCWLERKERRPTFTELKKEISILLNKEGSKPDEYVNIL